MAPPPNGTVAYIDLEGNIHNVLEVGLLIVRHGQPFAAFLYYGKITDFVDYKQACRCCHALKYDILTNHGLTQRQLADRVKFHLEYYKVEQVYANGVDVKEWLTNWLISTPFTNIPLLRWAQRIFEDSHRKAIELRDDPTKTLCGIRCCAHKGTIRNNRPIVQANGPHCALADCYEVFLYHTILDE